MVMGICTIVVACGVRSWFDADRCSSDNNSTFPRYYCCKCCKDRVSPDINKVDHVLFMFL